MSTISASAQVTDRPASITGASLLLLLVVMLTIPTVIVTMDGFDAAFVIIAATFASLKLAAAGGLWRCRKWAMFVGLGATLLDTLLSVMTIADAPSGAEAAFSTVLIVAGFVTLILLVLPSSRRAYV